MRSVAKKIYRRLRQIGKLGTRIGKQEILVLGDSHAAVFARNSARIPGYWLRVVSVGGATISGLQNPNSVTQAMPIFQKALRQYRGRICVTILGEVDTGFVIWHRSEKYGTSINEILKQTVDRYIAFVESIRRDKQVIIISTPLPTIQDGQDWGEIASLRKEVKATLLERTNLTVELNRRMEDYAAENGIMYLNLDSLSLNKDGVVKSELLNTKASDHHYDAKTYLEITMPRLIRIVEQVSAGMGDKCRA